ncbi:Imm8 family immunity protein [uncultured Clostridium sp.]|jgi:hypothetical protein|uniref:Imm8 family immunity protein n=1 Tax=uncultured Clostridium sp. TaxID=59620 RepID=UPI00261EB0FE|nr:Imm8 family immunity protein [uncultured Clostridium sp.]MCI9053417.1 hypothetical protein [Lachnospiraceae bacterium]
MITPVLDCILDIEEPEDIKDFVMHLEACIGEKGEEGSEYFSFRIITPKRLQKLSKEIGPMLLRSIFVVTGSSMKENIDYVTQEINKLLLECSRNTWEETALAINYYLDWEYYDPKQGICDYYKISRNLIE